MALLALTLVLLNVVLCIALALSVFRYGGDATVVKLLGLAEPSRQSAAESRRERLEAEQNAWRFDA